MSGAYEKHILLAKSAIESGSYKDAYKIASDIVSKDVSIKDAWLVKGLAGAGLLATSDEITSDEVFFSLEQGLKDTNTQDSSKAAQLLAKSYDSLISNLDHELKEKIIDHHKVPMPKGGSVLLHRIAQKGYARLTAKNLAKDRFTALQLLEHAYQIGKSKELLEKLAHEVESFFSHSNQYSDYLTDEIEIKSQLDKLKKEVRGLAQEAGIEVKKQSSQGAGCFIATAAMGSSAHPKVEILRYYRDEVLDKSTTGRFFIKCYYLASPPIAKWISKGNMRKKAVRIALVVPVIGLIKKIMR